MLRADVIPNRFLVIATYVRVDETDSDRGDARAIEPRNCVDNRVHIERDENFSCCTDAFDNLYAVPPRH